MRLGDDYSLVSALGNRVCLHVARQEYEQAITTAHQAPQIAQLKKNRRAEGQLHLTLASAYEGQQDWAAAEQSCEEAIHILSLTQDRALIGDAYERYGVFLAARGAYKQAYEHMRLAHTATLPEAR